MLSGIFNRSTMVENLHLYQHVEVLREHAQACRLRSGQLCVSLEWVILDDDRNDLSKRPEAI